MAEARALFAQLQGLWRSWPVGRRLSVLAGSLVGVGTLLGLVLWGSQVTYAPLMSNLAPEDAAQLVTELDKDRVPYRIAAGGTVILVPDDQVHKLRLKLAGEGLPKGAGVGFELFASSEFGMSRLAEQVNYRRALEGELQRTIRSLEAVREARVHIVAAERSLFKEQQDHARAAVTVHLHHGRRLTGPQVQAIVHLVASSVAEIAPENVTVIDGTGVVLAKGGDAMSTAAAAFDQERAIERGLEERVTEILERTLGPGRVSVRVAADVDATQRERTTESFDPESAVLRSEQVSAEQHATGNAPATGIPGARSNLVGVAVSATGESGTSRTAQTKNYEISKVVSREVSPTGRLRRLSVAVLVDAARIAETGATAPAQSTEELTKLTDLVKKAVGFDETRGDQVVVHSAPFQPMEEATAAADSDRPPAWLPYFEKFWRAGLAALAIVLVAVIMLRRRRAGPAIRQEVFAVPRTVREIEATMAATAAPGYGQGINTVPVLPARAADPNRAAAVLRDWLEEAP